MLDKPGMIENKTWGTTRRLYVDGTSHLDFIEVVPFGFSSRHMHVTKSNLFLVTRGVLRVATFEGDGVLDWTRCYGPDLDCSTVNITSSVQHCFYAHTEVEAFELYVSDEGRPIQLSDIRRYSERGVDGNQRYWGGYDLTGRIEGPSFPACHCG